MRNLRKLTAVIIVIALVLTSMTAAFAATTTPVNADKAATLKDLGLYAGTDDNDVSAGLDGALTTQDSLVFLAKLFGYKAAADELTADEVTKALAKFADAKDIASYARNVVAYSAINGILSGSTKDGKYYVGAKDTVTAARFATFMLKQMGYVVPAFTEAVAQIAEVEGSKVSASEAGDLTRDLAVGIMYGALTAEKASGATVIADIVGTDAALKAIALKAGLLVSGELAVTSIKAKTAKSFLVTFTRPVTDEDKITFDVKRLTTAVTVTTSWNEDKTEATLATSSNLAESTYAVSVLADAKEIAKENISITAQKIAKIEFTSKSVSVTVKEKIGYVNFKVYDQYDNDITTSSMANTLNPQVGVNGDVTIKNGLMTIKNAVPDLMTLQALSVVLYDTSAGITATKSLPISTAVGTLSSFEFGSIDNVKLVEGDTTTVFYIPYTAKDMAGNETKDYELVKNGLIDSNSNTSDVDLVVSLSSNVTARVVKDPANSKQAAIEAKYTGTSDFVMDMPITITAMTYGGGSTSIQTTLAKAKAVETIMLMAPSETVAAGETPEIPFEAYDKNGDRVTNYSDFSGDKVIATGFKIEERADGTAKFVMEKLDVKGTKTLSANIKKSGKVSNILSINVQDKAYPASVTFDQSGIIGAMENGAVQKIEFGDDLKVYDQYDRLISDDDINNKYFNNKIITINGVAYKYYIQPSASGDAKLTASNTGAYAAAPALGDMKKSDDIYVRVKPATTGSSTLEFALVKEYTPAGGTLKQDVIDSASSSISIVKTEDIDSYAIDTLANPIYTFRDDVVAGINGANIKNITKREEQYSFNAKAYGLTSAGTKVLLANTPVAVATLSNSTDFMVTTTATGAAVAYDGIRVLAKKLGDNKTSASTNVTITIVHNNKVRALTTTVASSTTDPVAKDIVLEGAGSSDGYYGGPVDGSGNDIGVAPGKYMIQKFVPNVALAAGTYNRAADAITANLACGAETNSEFYFYIKDSYGSKGMAFSDFRIAKAVNSSGVLKATPVSSSIDSNGTLTINAGDSGYVLYVTAVTNNGLSATMKILVK